MIYLNNFECQGVTKSKQPCTNIGSYIDDNNHVFCYWHVSRLEENCVICLCKLFVPCILKCGHSFHKQCITKWFIQHKSCPVFSNAVAFSDIAFL